MTSRPVQILTALVPALGLCVLLTGCSHDLDDYGIHSLPETNFIDLDREQVSLTEAQLLCGLSNELWEQSPADGTQRSIYRLLPKGRELQFSDDIYDNDPEYVTPYTQVRGKFHLNLGAVASMQDGPDGAKLIQGALGVRIPHACFADPLPIMGASKGKFTTKLAPTLIYENSDKGWLPTKLLH